MERVGRLIDLQPIYLLALCDSRSSTGSSLTPRSSNSPAPTCDATTQPPRRPKPRTPPCAGGPNVTRSTHTRFPIHRLYTGVSLQASNLLNLAEPSLKRSVMWLSPACSNELTNSHEGRCEIWRRKNQRRVSWRASTSIRTSLSSPRSMTSGTSSRRETIGSWDLADPLLLNSDRRGLTQ